jgi:RHS repeat-associated protein
VGLAIGHQGLYHDAETGLIYNRARMLHPTLGRFTQRDPLGYVDGMSIFAYYAGMKGGVDPNGHWFLPPIRIRPGFEGEFWLEPEVVDGGGAWFLEKYERTFHSRTDSQYRRIHEAESFSPCDRDWEGSEGLRIRLSNIKEVVDEQRWSEAHLFLPTERYRRVSTARVATKTISFFLCACKNGEYTWIKHPDKYSREREIVLDREEKVEKWGKRVMPRPEGGYA